MNYCSVSQKQNLRAVQEPQCTLTLKGEAKTSGNISGASVNVQATPLQRKTQVRGFCHVMSSVAKMAGARETPSSRGNII